LEEAVKFACCESVIRYRTAVMVLVSFWLFLRSAELTELNIEDVEVSSPVGGSVSWNGPIPNRLYITVKERKVKGSPQRLCLWKQVDAYSNPYVCPIIHLMNWLAILKENDRTSGPLFPTFTRDSLHPKFEKANEELVIPRVKPEQFSQEMSTLFKDSGCTHVKFTSHSCRRSQAQHAKRCGAQDSEIQQSGSWKGNTFIKYIGNANHLRDTGRLKCNIKWKTVL
jgi:hypothetical protein